MPAYISLEDYSCFTPEEKLDYYLSLDPEEKMGLCSLLTSILKVELYLILRDQDELRQGLNIGISNILEYYYRLTNEDDKSLYFAILEPSFKSRLFYTLLEGSAKENLYRDIQEYIGEHNLDFGVHVYHTSFHDISCPLKLIIEERLVNKVVFYVSYRELSTNNEDVTYLGDKVECLAYNLRSPRTEDPIRINWEKGTIKVSKKQELKDIPKTLDFKDIDINYEDLAHNVLGNNFEVGEYVYNTLFHGEACQLKFIITEKEPNKTVCYMMYNLLGSGSYGNIFAAERIEFSEYGVGPQSLDLTSLQIKIDINKVVKFIDRKRERLEEIKQEIEIQSQFIATEHLYLTSTEEKEEKIKAFVCMDRLDMDLYEKNGSVNVIDKISLKDRMSLICQFISQINEFHHNTAFSTPVVHGDLKTSNVMTSKLSDDLLTVDGLRGLSLLEEKSEGEESKGDKSKVDEPLSDEAILQVVDFGLSFEVSSEADFDSLYTHYQGILGNPIYFAPETIDGKFGYKTDIFMMVYVLTRLLGTQSPLEDKNREYHRLYRRYGEYLSTAQQKLIAGTSFNINLSDGFNESLIARYDLAEVVKQYLNKMQSPDYMDRPDIEEVLRFFTLINNIICFEDIREKVGEDGEPLLVEITQDQKYIKYLVEIYSFFKIEEEGYREYSFEINDKVREHSNDFRRAYIIYTQELKNIYMQEDHILEEYCSELLVERYDLGNVIRHLFNLIDETSSSINEADMCFDGIADLFGLLNKVVAFENNLDSASDELRLSGYIELLKKLNNLEGVNLSDKLAVAINDYDILYEGYTRELDLKFNSRGDYLADAIGAFLYEMSLYYMFRPTLDEVQNFIKLLDKLTAVEVNRGELVNLEYIKYLRELNNYSKTMDLSYKIDIEYKEVILRLSASQYDKIIEASDWKDFYKLNEIVNCFNRTFISFKKHYEVNLEELSKFDHLFNEIYNLETNLIDVSSKDLHFNRIKYLEKLNSLSLVDLSSEMLRAYQECMLHLKYTYTVGVFKEHLKSFDYCLDDIIDGYLKDLVSQLELSNCFDLEKSKSFFDLIDKIAGLALIHDDTVLTEAEKDDCQESLIALESFIDYAAYKEELRNKYMAGEYRTDLLVNYYDLPTIINKFSNEIQRSGPTLSVISNFFKLIDNIVHFEVNPLDESSRDDQYLIYLTKLNNFPGIDLSDKITSVEDLETFKVKYNSSLRFFSCSEMKRHLGEFRDLSELESLLNDEDDINRFYRSREVLSEMVS